MATNQKSWKSRECWGGREAGIGQVPDVPRLVDIYVLIYEVKDWLKMSPINLETWSKSLVNA